MSETLTNTYFFDRGMVLAPYPPNMHPAVKEYVNAFIDPRRAFPPQANVFVRAGIPYDPLPATLGWPEREWVFALNAEAAGRLQALQGWQVETIVDHLGFTRQEAHQFLENNSGIGIAIIPADKMTRVIPTWEVIFSLSSVGTTEKARETIAKTSYHAVTRWGGEAGDSRRRLRQELGCNSRFSGNGEIKMASGPTYNGEVMVPNRKIKDLFDPKIGGAVIFLEK